MQERPSSLRDRLAKALEASVDSEGFQLVIADGTGTSCPRGSRKPVLLLWTEEPSMEMKIYASDGHQEANEPALSRAEMASARFTYLSRGVKEAARPHQGVEWPGIVCLYAKTWQSLRPLLGEDRLLLLSPPVLAPVPPQLGEDSHACPADPRTASAGEPWIERARDLASVEQDSFAFHLPWPGTSEYIEQRLDLLLGKAPVIAQPTGWWGELPEGTFIPYEGPLGEADRLAEVLKVIQGDAEFKAAVARGAKAYAKGEGSIESMAKRINDFLAGLANASNS